MKGLGEKIEKIMMAITFAESGEHETARELMKETDRKDIDRPTLSKRPGKEYRASAPGR
ncbi:MAG: hypothetical protein HZA15_00035 [Nitrospirae bacterium]|nr:hypothetical protein [Nitrospirota bacterium]